MVAYLKVGPQVRTYSDYLRATHEAEKENSIELPQGPRAQTTNGPPRPRATSFFPLRKLKGNQSFLKKPTVHLAHLEDEDAQAMMKDQESDMIPVQNHRGDRGVYGSFGKDCKRHLKQMRNAATTVASWNISSAIACL